MEAGDESHRREIPFSRGLRRQGPPRARVPRLPFLAEGAQCSLKRQTYTRLRLRYTSNGVALEA